MVGGQGLGPAFLTVSITKLIIPSAPSAGFNMAIVLTFSLPNPYSLTLKDL